MNTANNKKEQKIIQIKLTSYSNRKLLGLFNKKERIDKSTDWVSIDFQSLLSLFRAIRIMNMPFKVGDFSINRTINEVIYSLGGDLFSGAIESKDLERLGELISLIKDDKIDLFHESFVLANDNIFSKERKLKLLVRRIVIAIC